MGWGEPFRPGGHNPLIAHPFARRAFDGKCATCGGPRDAHATEVVPIKDDRA